jgi:hypothetical protein
MIVMDPSRDGYQTVPIKTMQVPREGLETLGKLKMVNSNSMLKLSILLSIY